jgi:hypothetical protein
VGVVSYVHEVNSLSFDLKDFIDDAASRGYLDSSLHLQAIMGGIEIWSGGQGASIDAFTAEVQ